jgi:HAMP domain-containing protein
MPSRGAIANRTLTVVAAAFLAFDGACLVFAGVALHRLLLDVMGACLVASSGLVFVYWRWHRRREDEIADARRDLRQQARAFRDMIQRN